MCEVKFTKGEWQYEDGWSAVYTPEGCTVCEFTESNTREHKDYNAHVIAAAPKMYEVIERVAELLERNDPYTLEWIEMYAGSLSGLLAKARGENV